MNDKMIEISESEYYELIDQVMFLSALFEAGVDNWSGYDQAIQIKDEWDNEEENV